MPSNPSQLSGKILNVGGIGVDGATVTLTHSSGTISIISNSPGEYILNLGDLSSWSAGDSAILTATKTSVGTKTQTITLASGGTVLNITLEETSGFTYVDKETKQQNLVMAMPVTFDGEKVTNSNPLPVNLCKIPIQDGELTLSYTGFNLTGIVKVINGKTYTRTLTYTGSNLTGVSNWVVS